MSRDADGLPVCDCTNTAHSHGTQDMYALHGCGCVPCTAANNLLFRRLKASPLPVCDCPRAKHVHGTRVMYNRHLCRCLPCGAANRKYTLEYKGRSVPECGCPQARHVHGTRGMYDKHRCPCPPCREANRISSNLHRRPKPPRHPMVDGALVRDRIGVLRAAGLTIDEIADMCALSPSVIAFDLNGRDGRPAPARVRASTLAALNAIRARDIAAVERPAGRKVDSDLPRRQVQALFSFGWDAQDIAERVGVHRTTIGNLLRGLGTTEKVRAGIGRVHAELHGTRPVQDTPARKGRSTLARERATANGWTADTADDHEYAAYARAA